MARIVDQTVERHVSPLARRFTCEDPTGQDARRG